MITSTLSFSPSSSTTPDATKVHIVCHFSSSVNPFFWGELATIKTLYLSIFNQILEPTWTSLRSTLTASKNFSPQPLKNTTRSKNSLFHRCWSSSDIFAYFYIIWKIYLHVQAATSTLRPWDIILCNHFKVRSKVNHRLKSKYSEKKINWNSGFALLIDTWKEMFD